MSDSVRPHRRQPTRLPRPWDSPGRNTGVGCHFLLQCMKVKSESEVAKSCPTLSDPMDCSLPGSSIHGIFQARVLEWGAIAFSSWCLQISTKLSLWQDCHSSLDLGPYSPMNREQYQGRTLTALPCECLDPSPQLGMRAVMGQSWVPRSPLQEERKSLPR